MGPLRKGARTRAKLMRSLIPAKAKKVKHRARIKSFLPTYRRANGNAFALFSPPDRLTSLHGQESRQKQRFRIMAQSHKMLLSAALACFIRPVMPSNLFATLA